jgi:hypothetical protein
LPAHGDLQAAPQQRNERMASRSKHRRVEQPIRRLDAKLVGDIKHMTN